MKIVWALIYNSIIIPLTYILFRIAGLFNDKIKRGIQGRKKLFTELEAKLNRLPGDRKRVWFHFASYGEFEQAKPVLTALKKSDPSIIIIASLFSPSAYENIKKFPAVDLISYLPFDSYFNAKKFISLLKPDVALIIRHDIWPNHIWRAQKHSIPLILFDASLRPDTSRFYPIIKSINKTIYNTFDDILATTPKDAERLKKIYSRHDHLLAIGDTKYDQAYQRTLELDRLKAVLELDAFEDKRVFVAAQTHPSDEKHVLPAYKRVSEQFDNSFMIFVPHEPSAEYVAAKEEEFRALHISTLRLSQYIKHETKIDFQVLIIDSIGILANLFRFARVVFMGGSFRPGVHNVLEPAVYGIPILFGPRIEVSSEAQELAERKGAFIVRNEDELFEKLMLYFSDENERQRVGNIAKELVMENVGATQKVVECIYKYL